MSWLRATIVRRLVVITLAVGLLTGIVGVLTVQRLERRDLLVQAGERNLARAQRTATRIDDRFATIRSQLDLLASNELVALLAPDAETELAVALRVSRDIDRLALYDADGLPVAAAGAAELVRPGDLPARPVDGADGLRRRQAQIVREELPSVELVVEVQHPPGEVRGYLIGHAPIDLVSQDVTAQPAGEEGTIFLTDTDGVVLAHRELQRVLAEEVFPVREVFATSDRAIVDIAGEPTLVTAVGTRTMPGWVVIEQSRAEIVTPARLRLGGITQVLVAVVAAIVAAVILAGRRLLRPLGPLVEATRLVESGRLDVRVDVGGAGEAAVLAERFNRMAAALRDRQAELEQAQRSTRESEQRLRVMVEGVSDYAIVLLDVDGRVRSWNTGAERLTGYGPSAAIGRALSDLYDPDDPPPDPVAAAAATGRGDVEGWCRRESGTRFWAHIVVTALEGGAYGYATILHDLTDRRAARRAREAALRREREAAAELRRANQLKDEFLGMVAHEMRTPVSAILGAAHLLNHDDPELDAAERRRFADMIERHAEDMKGIVERLVDVIRLESGRVRLAPERLRLADEVRRVVDSMSRELHRHRREILVADVEVVIDPTLVRQVVSNLLSNAAKFSPPGTTITVRGHVQDTTLLLEVEDQGHGISPDQHDQIFELFRQADSTEPTSRGTGVGLAIVRRYVELAGGGIRVNSHPGGGSTFRVVVPLGPAPATPKVTSR